MKTSILLTLFSLVIFLSGCGSSGGTYSITVQPSPTGSPASSVLKSSPLIVNNSILLGYPSGKLDLYDSSGATIWSRQLASEIVSTPAFTLSSNIILLESSGILNVLDSNGNTTTSTPVCNTSYSSPAVDESDNIYVGCENSLFQSLDLNGRVKWSYITDGAISSSPSILQSSAVYFGSDTGTAYSLSMTGTLNWSYGLQNSIKSSPALSNDGSVVFTDLGGKVSSFSTTGVLQWQYISSSPIDASPIIDGNGNIFVGNHNGDFISLSSTGQLNWSTTVVGSIHATAILASNNKLFFGTASGNFYELDKLLGSVTLLTNQNDKIYSSPTIYDGVGVYFGTDLNSLNIVNQNVAVDNKSGWYKYRSSVSNPGMLTCQTPNTSQILNSFEKFGPSVWAASPNGVLVSQDNQALSGIISPIEFKNYSVATTFTSTYSDCDTMAVVAAATRSTSGVLHSLLAVRQGCNSNDGHYLGATRWGLVLDIGERVAGQYDSSEILIVDGASLVSNVTVQWPFNDVYVGIERNENIITAVTSAIPVNLALGEPKRANPVDPSTRLTIDLSTDSRLSIFKNGSSFGFAAHSKPFAEFDKLTIKTTGKCL